MKVKFYSLVLLTLLLSLIINIVVNRTGNWQLMWLPEMVSVLSLSVLFSQQRVIKLDHKSAATLVILLTLVTFLLFQWSIQLIENGHGAGSSIISVVFMVAIFFVFFLLSADSTELAYKLIKYSSIVYTIHLIFILLEVYFIKIGNTDIMNILFNNNYKPALDRGLNPQGLYNNSQVTSQISLVSAILFLALFSLKEKLLIKYNIIYLLNIFVSIAVFFAYPTTTANIAAIASALLFLIIILRHRKLKLLYIGIVAVALFAFSSVIIEIVFYKFSSQNFDEYDSYVQSFTSNIVTFFKLDLPSQLFGTSDIATLNDIGLAYTDFGFGNIMLKIGAIPMIFLSVALSIILIKVFINFKHVNNQSLRIWVFMGFVNAIIAFVYYITLVHYTISIDQGGRTIFAFHISVALYSLHVLRKKMGSLVG